MADLVERLERIVENIDRAREGCRQAELLSREMQRLLGYPFAPSALDKAASGWNAGELAQSKLRLIIADLKSDG
jgi:hypothetical protein